MTTVNQSPSLKVNNFRSKQLSPSTIGHKFLNQYYGVWRKSPEKLYRFYTNSSSFIHDDPKLYSGIKNIQNRIAQLNLRHSALYINHQYFQRSPARGVVIQTAGKLSINEGPMRPFTQTFVLVRENSKKYYVHNNIFRYLDRPADEAANSTGIIDTPEDNNTNAPKEMKLAKAMKVPINVKDVKLVKMPKIGKAIKVINDIKDIKDIKEPKPPKRIKKVKGTKDKGAKGVKAVKASTNIKSRVEHPKGHGSEQNVSTNPTSHAKKQLTAKKHVPLGINARVAPRTAVNKRPDKMPMKKQQPKPVLT